MKRFTITKSRDLRLDKYRDQFGNLLLGSVLVAVFIPLVACGDGNSDNTAEVSIDGGVTSTVDGGTAGFGGAAGDIMPPGVAGTSGAETDAGVAGNPQIPEIPGTPGSNPRLPRRWGQRALTSTSPLSQLAPNGHITTRLDDGRVLIAHSPVDMFDYTYGPSERPLAMVYDPCNDTARFAGSFTTLPVDARAAFSTFYFVGLLASPTPDDKVTAVYSWGDGAFGWGEHRDATTRHAERGRGLDAARRRERLKNARIEPTRKKALAPLARRGLPLGPCASGTRRERAGHVLLWDGHVPQRAWMGGVGRPDNQ